MACLIFAFRSARSAVIPSNCSVMDWLCKHSMTRPETLASSISVHYEAAKEFNDETFYLASGHQHSPGIIRNRAITDGATADKQHERARGQTNDRKISHRHIAARHRYARENLGG